MPSKRRSANSSNSAKKLKPDPIIKEPYGLVWYLGTRATGAVMRADIPMSVKLGGFCDAPNPVDWTEPNDGKKYKAKLVALGCKYILFLN